MESLRAGLNLMRKDIVKTNRKSSAANGTGRGRKAKGDTQQEPVNQVAALIKDALVLPGQVMGKLAQRPGSAINLKKLADETDLIQHSANVHKEFTFKVIKKNDMDLEEMHRAEL